MKIRLSPTGSFVTLPTSAPEFDNGNSGAGTKAINWALGPAQRLRLTGNAALSLYTGLTSREPTWVQLALVQDAVGSRVPTLPGVLTPAGAALTFSTAALAVDLVSLYFDGSLLYASIAGLRFQ